MQPTDTNTTLNPDEEHIHICPKCKQELEPNHDCEKEKKALDVLEHDLYIGVKLIVARPMDHETFLRSQGKFTEGQETLGDGYEVTYDDNYVSWSPKRVFDTHYRKVTNQERILFNRANDMH